MVNMECAVKSGDCSNLQAFHIKCLQLHFKWEENRSLHHKMDTRIVGNSSNLKREE